MGSIYHFEAFFHEVFYVHTLSLGKQCCFILHFVCSIVPQLCALSATMSLCDKLLCISGLQHTP